MNLSHLPFRLQQHTVTGALGLIFAAFFARSVSTLRSNQAMDTVFESYTTSHWYVRETSNFTIVLFSNDLFVHIVANMQCMKLIAFDSFNNARMNLIIDEYLTQSNEAEPLDIAKRLDTSNSTLS